MFRSLTESSLYAYTSLPSSFFRFCDQTDDDDGIDKQAQCECDIVLDVFLATLCHCIGRAVDGWFTLTFHCDTNFCNSCSTSITLYNILFSRLYIYIVGAGCSCAWCVFNLLPQTQKWAQFALALRYSHSRREKRNKASVIRNFLFRSTPTKKQRRVLLSTNVLFLFMFLHTFFTAFFAVPHWRPVRECVNACEMNQFTWSGDAAADKVYCDRRVAFLLVIYFATLFPVHSIPHAHSD